MAVVNLRAGKMKPILYSVSLPEQIKGTREQGSKETGEQGNRKTGEEGNKVASVQTPLPLRKKSGRETFVNRRR